MRNRLIYSMLIGLLLFAFSCNEKEYSTEKFSTTVQEGNWKVSMFDYTDKDLTGYYDGYKFTFTTQNTVTAAGENFYAGKWWVKYEGDQLILTLDFPKITPIQLLNYDWVVINYDSQMINLSWDNPYYGGTDYLVFEKLQL